ncbi:unnamed protein product, partial [Prorocentrum cordatum]
PLWLKTGFPASRVSICASCVAAMALCMLKCGRPAFRGFVTCCNRCSGPDGPHTADCASKCGLVAPASDSPDSASASEILALLLGLGVPAKAAEEYLPVLLGAGYDSAQAFRRLTGEDLARLGIKEGHRRLICEDEGEHRPASAAEPPAAKASAPKGRAKARAAAGAPPPRPSGTGLPLDGLVVCVSGAMSTVRREFQSNLREQGAQVILFR